MTRVLVLAAILSVTLSTLLLSGPENDPGIELDPGITQDVGPMQDPFG